MTTTKDIVSKKIDGVKYELQLLNTSRAFITGQKLIKLSLPSAGAIADELMSETDEFYDSQTFTTIAMLILRQMEEVDVLEIIKELLEDLTADGEKVDFEKHFRAEMGVLVSVVEFALRENYSSLFTSTSLMKKLTAYMKEFQTRQVQNETEQTSNEQE